MLSPSLIAAFCFATLTAKTPYFVPEVIDDQVNRGRSIAVGDVDGDGKPDILLAEKSQVVWYRNGDWTRFVLTDSLDRNHPVSIAARDTDGDGKVELAIGTASEETSDTAGSGSLYYLIRPEDPTRLWTPVELDHGSAIRQIQWVATGDDSYQLVVLPRHSEETEEDGMQWTNIQAYEKPDVPDKLPWQLRIIQQPMPLAHHLHIYDDNDREKVYLSGDSGVMGFSFKNGRWTRNTANWLARGRPLSEMHRGRIVSRNADVFAAIEPFPGHIVTVYTPGLTDSLLVYDKIKRVILEREMEEGHGLGMADFMGLGRDQVVAGWRKPNADGDFGIKLYVPFNPYWEAMDVYWLDRGGIACEDLRVADMDGDGKLDIIAFGGSTNNLKIYWNRTE